jgi:hypothetical protein
MHWWVNGLNVNPSVPAGASFSGAGNGIYYTPGQVTNSKVYLNYGAAVQINSQSVDSANFTDEANFYYGSTWWYVQGN